MSAAPSLPDLDALDHAALKAVILAQQDQHREQQDIYRAEREKYISTLNSRTGEIERLLLLVEKLQRMLFGTKSEKGSPPDRAAGVAVGRTSRYQRR